jgi:hypothetical protein
MMILNTVTPLPVSAKLRRNIWGNAPAMKLVRLATVPEAHVAANLVKSTKSVHAFQRHQQQLQPPPLQHVLA